MFFQKSPKLILFEGFIFRGTTHNSNKIIMPIFIWVWSLKCTLLHGFYEMLSQLRFHWHTWPQVPFPIGSSSCILFCILVPSICLFLSSLLTLLLLMTMDTRIDNRPFGSKSRFPVPTGRKKRQI